MQLQLRVWFTFEVLFCDFVTLYTSQDELNRKVRNLRIREEDQAGRRIRNIHISEQDEEDRKNHSKALKTSKNLRSAIAHRFKILFS